MRWAEHITQIGEKGKCTGYVGKLEGNRPLGRPRHRWVDNIKMNVRDIPVLGTEINSGSLLLAGTNYADTVVDFVAWKLVP
jgi:hypothetical protein